MCVRFENPTFRRKPKLEKYPTKNNLSLPIIYSQGTYNQSSCIGVQVHLIHTTKPSHPSSYLALSAIYLSLSVFLFLVLWGWVSVHQSEELSFVCLKMGRKCSHCGNNGHNSRTCAAYRGANIVGGGLRLFGVQLDIPSPSSSSPLAMKKSCSMDCFLSSSLVSSSSTSPSSSLSSSRVSLDEISEKTSLGYLSDNLMGTQAQDRRKGMKNMSFLSPFSS